MKAAAIGLIVLGILGPGEVIGELSLIDGGARSASAEALTRAGKALPILAMATS